MFKSLKTRIHHFSFNLDSRFFGHFENPDFRGGAININVKMDKQPHLITLFLAFSGNVRVICDRCLDEFDLPLDFESTLFAKFGEESLENDADVIYIDTNTHELNLAEYFMESIRINLPIRRVHQKDHSGNDLCNKLMIEKLDKHQIKDNIKRTDPRWDSLKDIISKQN